VGKKKLGNSSGEICISLFGLCISSEEAPISRKEIRVFLSGSYVSPEETPIFLLKIRASLRKRVDSSEESTQLLRESCGAGAGLSSIHGQIAKRQVNRPLVGTWLATQYATLFCGWPCVRPLKWRFGGLWPSVRLRGHRALTAKQRFPLSAKADDWPQAPKPPLLNLDGLIRKSNEVGME